MWKYNQYLPIRDHRNITSLGEGSTPVCELEENVFLKLEQLNPTGSYKDRFASCAVSWMKENGKKHCLAATSGNTGSALAAYCARARIPCHILVMETAPHGKLLQMLAYGASVRRIRGLGLSPAVSARLSEALREKTASTSAEFFLSAFTHSPFGMEGVKTIAYELIDGLDFIEHVFVPVGGGGLLTAVFRGFQEFFRAGKTKSMPRIHAVQPEGCATVTGPLCRGEFAAISVSCASAISGLQVPAVIDGHLALTAVRATGGSGQSVSDAAIYSAQADLARQGIYCEPAGATAYAGYRQAKACGVVAPEDRVVCLVTGHGFKDPDSVQKIVCNSVAEVCDLEEALTNGIFWGIGVSGLENDSQSSRN